MTVGKFAKWLIGGVLFSVALYAGALLFLTWPISEYSINKAGVFGDSFGILTSTFSGLAFAGLIITILLQREELGLQREELRETRKEIAEQKKIFKNQNFNESFYRLLDYHKKNLAELSVFSDEKGERLKGIDALSFLITRLRKSYAGYGFQGFANADEDTQLEMAYALFVEVQTILVRQSRYVETIVSIFSLIDSQLDTDSEKEIYLDLLASQLTVYELKYIFYQCLVSKPKDKLKSFVHSSNLLTTRGQDIGVPNTHRDIYLYMHDYGIPRAKSKFYVPFDQNKIRRVKKKNRARKKEHNLARQQEPA